MSKRLNQTIKLVEKYRDILGLLHWRIKVIEQNETDDYASVVISNRANYATMFINTIKEDFDKEIENTVIHELNHLAHARIDDFIDNIIEGLDSKQTQEILKEQYLQLMEQFIDSNTSTIEYLAKQNKNK
jgi:hypothetical protein